MTTLIIGYSIEWGLQTAFLFAALWIMIKFQKLNYNFLGLLGSAALGSAIDLIPLPFFLSDLIATGVLLVCVMKLTQSEVVDVIFTVFVGQALVFGMNLWLLGALMGDLRPSARENAEEAPSPREVKQEQRVAAADRSAPTNHAPRSAPAPAATPQPAAAGPQGVAAAKPASEKSAAELLKELSVRGVTRNGAKSVIVVQSGSKNYTLFLGDSLPMETSAGKVTVRFDELDKDWALLTLKGEQVKLAVQ